MEKRDQAYEDYKQSMKYKDIAEKYGVSLSAVKSWAARYWNKEKDKGKVATKNKKSCNQKFDKSQPKSRGAPKGNKNAVGNKGGAPKGSKNAQKHGGYSAIYFDTLDEDELSMIDDMPEDEETMLIQQIQLLSVRERRLMKAINKYQKNPLTVANVVTSKTERIFPKGEAGETEKKLYQEIRQEKIAERKISYLGTDQFTQTSTEASYNVVLRLERELTAVQSKKTKCIEALARLHTDNKDSDSDMDLVDDWIAAVEAGDDSG